jgi:C1A family cysteine protease
MDKGLFGGSPHRPNKNLRLIFGLLIIGLLGIVAAVSIQTPASTALSEIELELSEFHSFMSRYSKSYSSHKEYQTRFKIFRENLGFIRVNNQKNKHWSLGVNQFADMSMQEFRRAYLSDNYQIKTQRDTDDLERSVDIPSSIDWRKQGAVTGVKNQGPYGGDFAFSAAGAIEGIWKISGHPLVALSESQLEDCVPVTQQIPYGAFEYVIENGGIASEADYYNPTPGTCNTVDAKKITAKITGYSSVTSNSQDDLLAAIANQPVSVGVEADQPVWQFYAGGVVTKNCGTEIDHFVLAVGYDTDSTPSYYILKNSWGTSWGEAGYIRIGISSGAGVCGIQLASSYPKITK